MTNICEFATPVLNAVDAMDGAAFSKFFTDNGIFTFGNNPPIKGRKEIATIANGFFAAIAGIKHEILNTWVNDKSLVLQLTAEYVRKDGKIVRLPCVDIWTIEDGLISDYQIYEDTTPIFAP